MRLIVIAALLFAFASAVPGQRTKYVLDSSRTVIIETKRVDKPRFEAMSATRIATRTDSSLIKPVQDVSQAVANPTPNQNVVTAAEASSKAYIIKSAPASSSAQRPSSAPVPQQIAPNPVSEWTSLTEFQPAAPQVLPVAIPTKPYVNKTSQLLSLSPDCCDEWKDLCECKVFEFDCPCEKNCEHKNPCNRCANGDCSKQRSCRKCSKHSRKKCGHRCKGRSCESKHQKLFSVRIHRGNDYDSNCDCGSGNCENAQPNCQCGCGG